MSTKDSLQLSLGVEQPHHNRGLFSDHYLVNLLPNDPRWEKALAEAGEFLEWLRALYLSEKDVTFWKRRVVERCIYGVDKNPLAVELAKLSLWLATVASDQPLSFLDHHLKCGDSLIGASVADLGWAPPPVLSKKDQKRVEQQKAGQMNLFEYRLSQQLPAVMGKVLEITGRESDSYESVQAKEAADEAVRQLKAPFEAVANLWVSAYFGNEFSAAEYEEARDAIGSKGLWEIPTVGPAKKMARDRRFFHWELAFPEVFYDENGQSLGDAAGFDASIGNPPYVRQETIEKQTKEYFKKQFSDVYHGVADIYVYFVGLGLDLLSYYGFLGFITSGLFQKLNYGAPLRKALSTRSTLQSIIDFESKQLFVGALTYPIVLITINRKPLAGEKLLVLESVDVQRKQQFAYQGSFFELPNADEQWTFISTGLLRIIKGWEGSTALVNCLSDKIYRGVTTGLNKAFVINEEQMKAIISEDPNSARVIKPYVRGEDLHAWYQEESGLYLIFTRRGVNIKEYPGIENFLERFREGLEPQPEHWDHPKSWPGRKAGAYKWYEIQDSVDYYQAFERPRLHSTKVSIIPSFSLCMHSLYAANTSYILPIDEFAHGCFLLALLNSSISYFYCRTVFAPKANGYYEVQPNKLEQFPIPEISFSTPAEKLGQMLKKCQTLHGIYYKSNDLVSVTGFVEHELVKGRSDVIYHQLVFLAQEMIDMHKVKQKIAEDFWLDLEGATDSDGFEFLRDKGKWESTLWKFKACKPFVDEESHSTRHLDDSLGWNEEAFKAFVKALVGQVSNLSGLVRVYRKHHPTYLELTNRIERTDYLIDQIVYKLYGLTEEEIAIVENNR